MSRPAVNYADVKQRSLDYLKAWLADYPGTTVPLRAIKAALRNIGKDSLYEALLREVEQAGLGYADRELGLWVKALDNPPVYVV